MTECISVGHPPIDVTLRRHARARRLTLRVRPDGPILTIPTRLPVRTAESFLREREQWLRDRLDTLPQPCIVRPGAMLPFEGRQVHLAAGKGRTRLEAGETLIAAGPDTRFAARIRAFLIEAARARLTGASDRYAARLGVSHSGLTLRDTKSRWGSCTANGRLMYSWRLIMAPPDVLDYVAAHEVAHRVEMNHGPRFWALVAEICPDYAMPRKWLRDHGAELHVITFTA